MEKLERRLFISALIFALVAGTGAELEKRAIIYEQDRRVEQVIFYGGLGTSAASILSASYVSGRQNNKKKKKSNTDYTNQ